eukprot:TRINITY_DN72038_c0_g1_i1.p1 TRINITY_DN72038_c0_g1~~TRINITY_DN72038_c0_g1_i1.p1  ORF type:complete len:103 (+),score=10.54 TRINITY_DN72038_c0_g1_i1:116-424(+)
MPLCITTTIMYHPLCSVLTTGCYAHYNHYWDPWRQLVKDNQIVSVTVSTLGLQLVLVSNWMIAKDKSCGTPPVCISLVHLPWADQISDSSGQGVQNFKWHSL